MNPKIMFIHAKLRRPIVFALMLSLIAGSLATLVQLLLWWLNDIALPETLYRDIRLTAAIILPPDIIAPAVLHTAPDASMLLWASLIHGVLSLIYTAAFMTLAQSWQHRYPSRTPPLFSAGVLFGLTLYLINMHGLTWFMPWFASVRGWITIAAHVVFGLSLALLVRTNTRPIAPLLPI
jgi:hypothetical protein